MRASAFRKAPVRWRRVGTLAGVTTFLAIAMTMVPARMAAQTRGEASGETDDAPTRWQEKETDATKNEERRGWGFRWDDHPSLYIGRDTTVAFTARLQADLESSEAPIGDPAALDLTRRRFGIEGRIAGAVDFEFDYELGSDQPWRDAYLEYRQVSAVRVRAGRFKLPFSLDENTGPASLDFAYRSRAATQLAPGRDPGVMGSGRLLQNRLRYEAGWFAHDGRNARTRNPDRVYGGRTLAGRLTVQPFRGAKSAWRDLQVGLATTGSEVQEGFPALRGRTMLDAPFFTPDVWVQGHRRRLGIEMRWRPGPFSLKSEYIRVSTERRGQSVDDADLPPLVGTGWYLSGTWLASGESKSDGAVGPRRPLFRGGAGALELAARVEGLAFGSNAGPAELPSTSPRAANVLGNAERASTLGVNWYPVRGLRVQVNVIRESFTDPSLGPLPTQPAFWSSVVRFQLAI